MAPVVLGWILAAAQDAGGGEDLREEMRRLRETVERQQQVIDRLRERLDAVEAVREGPPAGAGTPQEESPAPPYASGFLHRFGRAPAYFGGYVDLTYLNLERRRLGEAAAEDPKSTFDPQRLVLLASADVSPRIKFWSEIELEEGGEEFEIEFAHMDLLARDWLNFRAGVLLAPFRFNLFHDSPIQELTQRPSVDRFVIPTVLRDPGVGAFGRIELAEDGAFLDYEAYVTNGFKGLNAGGDEVLLSRDEGLREARPHEGDLGGMFRDINDNKSVMGRLQLTPTLGIELGVAGHYGAYDERGDDALGLYSFDAAIEGGAIWNLLAPEDAGESWVQTWLYRSRFSGEIAYADIERDDFAAAAGIPGDLTGWDVEYNYRFMPDCLRRLLGPLATDESTFTLSARYDRTRMSRTDHEMVTLGLNYRPIPQTVLKFDYEFNLDDADEGFLFSIATYF